MPTETPMQLGMVGLGRMGAGIVRRLMKDGHRCVGYDVSPDAVKALEADGDTDDEREQEEGDRRERPAGCDPADANGGCLGSGRLH